MLKSSHRIFILLHKVPNVEKNNVFHNLTMITIVMHDYLQICKFIFTPPPPPTSSTHSKPFSLSLPPPPLSIFILFLILQTSQEKYVVTIEEIFYFLFFLKRWTLILSHFYAKFVDIFFYVFS